MTFFFRDLQVGLHQPTHQASVASSVRVFERANCEIVSIIGRDENLKQEILIKDCSEKCSQILHLRLQKPESPIMQVLFWEDIFLNIERGYGSDSKA